MCAWSGGTFTRANPTWTTDASLGIGIEAGRHDAQDNDFTTGINQCLNKDGSNSATNNLNLGGFRYTNSAAATARTDLAQVAQVQDGDYIWLGTTAGTATAQTATATPAITAYKAGQKFRMLVGSGLGSTGASATGHTLNINAIGAKQIVSNDNLNSSPTIGSWVAGAILELIYDGTYLRIINNPSGWQDYTLTTTNVTGTAPNVVAAINAIEVSRFIKIGKIVTWQIGVNFNLTVGGASTINITPPINAAAGIASTNAFWGNGVTVDFGGNHIAGPYFSSASNMKVFKNILAGTLWTAGAPNNYVRTTVVYEGV